MGSSCLQILDPKIWLSSETSDPKTWHTHPHMQTWQVPSPWDPKAAKLSEEKNVKEN